LKAMAAERAATMATTIQASFAAGNGTPGSGAAPAAAGSRRASSAPVRANGRAKTECSNLIISSVSRRRFQIMVGLTQGQYPFILPCLLLVLQLVAYRLMSTMLEASSLSDKGCVRSNNEDYCLVEPDLGLYVLADGMGGARAGERASRIAVDTVAETVLMAQHRDSQVLLRAVEEANRRVLETAQNDPSLEGMGTTLVAALELGGNLSIASVGDSRAYLLDDEGLRILTDDQTWVNEVGRPLGLDEDSLRNHPMRHVLTMAIGASAPLTVNYYSVPLSLGSLVLICSDGLHGVLDSAELERILKGGRNGDSLDESCRKLVDAAKEAGGPDNVTVVLMRKTA